MEERALGAAGRLRSPGRPRWRRTRSRSPASRRWSRMRSRVAVPSLGINTLYQTKRSDTNRPFSLLPISRRARTMTTPEQLVTDGGLETDLIFHHGIDLPDFAAFPLLEQERGRALLTRYYEEYAAIAAEAGAGLMLETPTWRANTDWASRLGYDAPALAAVNRDAVRFLRDVGDRWADRVPSHARQWPDRPAGRRLPARCRGRPGRGRGVPPPADRRVRRGRRGRDHGPDAHRRRRGARRRRGGEGRGAAGGDLVHGRDRRPAARRHHAWPRRSAPSTRPAGRRTSWSTARTPSTSSAVWGRTGPGASGSAASG